MKEEDREGRVDRKLAVGWFDNAPFRAICGKYVSRIKEVFFAWPGVTASRPMAEWTPERKQLFFEDIAWCRNEGMELDAIFNANCYRAKKWVPRTIGTRQPREEGKAEAGNR